MSDIFISYANADRPRVKPLVDALERQGWSVWWDRTLLPGQSWEELIEAALSEARCVIVLWSAESVRSDWVKAEAEEARQRKILVPALLDHVRIPLAFRAIQAADLEGWTGELTATEFQTLARAVTRILGDPVRLPSDDAQNVHAPEKPINLPLVELQPPKPFHWDYRPASPSPVPRAQSRRTWMWFVSAAVIVLIVGFGWYFVHGRPEVFRRAGEVRRNPKDGLLYVWIPPGKFLMGCSPGDRDCDDDENPAHEVTITRGFWMGKTEVTEAAYQRFIQASGRSDARLRNLKMPAISVSWDDAKSYCEWAGVRLPTEAEWEYAARAGSTAPRYNAIDAVAWYSGNSGGESHPVDQKLANAWGLHDTLGNAAEWVSDWYRDRYYQPTVGTDPIGPPTGTYHVLRGGWYNSEAKSVRLSRRRPGSLDGGPGIRCAGPLK